LEWRIAPRSQLTQTFELFEGKADERRGEDSEDNEDQGAMERRAGRRWETREEARAAPEAEAEAKAKGEAETEARRERAEREKVGAEERAHRI
jgi:hypothetical protein